MIEFSRMLADELSASIIENTEPDMEPKRVLLAAEWQSGMRLGELFQVQLSAPAIEYLRGELDYLANDKWPAMRREEGTPEAIFVSDPTRRASVVAERRRQYRAMGQLIAAARQALKELS